ncbi:hypothetical protein [Burkholderia oklahomensis]|uniref:EF-hand domain-containing protein n=1 Tax=Burkholderia oklahomensis TaxID=342113 RepID=A0AAI8B8D8_9BURK|nr:hypothetical protein [Burkholderia oklahomensis]AIO67446.1 hypothetical protein DM82_3568 [Burkholderia oklahomensis]AJX32950.1 hypothetical protein BG90_1235 [Burkholderia oklahomensis C6786]AOI43743.1 hypothetical protein WG70_30270 [Burkholderia oklahomensis EO147]AOI47330.1 hypothetical protein WI23_16975 [Burkholderia oklahomensis C6786]KUY49385.1 hypothetical protein WG70_20320 [Burkholderia oklahomensis EO147]
MFQILQLRRVFPAIALTVAATFALGASAVTLQAVSSVPPLHGGVDGPFFPKAASGVPASASATTGAQLQQQAQSRLAASLGASGALGSGAAVTKAQAQASGLGYVAKHFDEIDAAHTGKVTLKQVQQFIEQQRQ